MIVVENLSFTYPGRDEPTLKNLNFEVRPGEVLGFLGPSGAGKSTTQKILIGLLQEFAGNVTVMDRPLAKWKSEYYEHIGVSFERPNHFQKLTALENLNYFRSLYQGPTNEPRQMLELVGLVDDADRRVAQFSKGMQNRLNVARALLNKPRLLFLDEPTTGLDPVNARKIKNLIVDLRKQGETVFLCTHNMTVAEEVCDRVAFIIDGQIELIDSPRELKLRYGRRMVRIEYGIDEQTSSVEFSLENLADNAEFLSTLRRDDLQTIHTQETSLENIFIEVTGRELA